MRVLLVKPPIRACTVEVGRHVPIGLAYLSAALRAAGHHTELFDALAYTEDNHVVAPDAYTAADRRKVAAHPRWSRLVHWGARPERVAEAIAAAAPDVVGVSCMFTPYYEPAYEVARMAARLVPSATVVLGGQHPTVAPEHALAVDEIDVAVLGEGEDTVVALVDALQAGADLDDVGGLAFRCGRGLCGCERPGLVPHVTPRRQWIHDLDALPLPAADQLDFARYDQATALITSRGCPFSCSFCTVHATVGKTFRARAPERVVDEIEHYVDRHGVRTFLVEDDNFTFDVDRVRALCAEVRSRELDVRLQLPNGMTVVDLSPALVEDMAGAGFERLFLGLETTGQERLRAVRKGFTSLDKVTQGVSWFAAHGTVASASLIVGLPGQPIGEVVEDSVSLAVRDVPFWTNPFYPIPGSPDFDACLASGLITRDTEFALFDQFNFAFGSDQLPPHELYWAWVATQAIAQWPAYVLEGAARRRDGDRVPVSGALERLVAASAHLLDAGPPEVPAVPTGVAVEADGLRVDVDARGCFCALQRLEPSAAAPVDDLCTFTGDVLAAAAALYTGRPLQARQVASRLAPPAAHCAFAVVDGVAPAWDVQRHFVTGLDAAVALPVAQPDLMEPR